MEAWELSSFADDLKALRNFFVRLEVHAEELRYRGLGAVKQWAEFEFMLELLPTIEKKMSAALKTARFVDRDIYNRLSQIADTGHLISGTLDLLVALKIAETRSNFRTQVVRVSASLVDSLAAAILSISSLFGVSARNRQNVFASIEQKISVRQTLVQLERTISLIESLHDFVWEKNIRDEDFFKPSNVDIERVNELIESALEFLQSDTFTPKPVKKEISEALGSARLELTQKIPNWRKIIGALVIASTILSGVASAPEALEVIQNAIKEILGTSIENVAPLERRPSPSNDRIKIALSSQNDKKI